jgi:hypothetical protein
MMPARPGDLQAVLLTAEQGPDKPNADDSASEVALLIRIPDRSAVVKNPAELSTLALLLKPATYGLVNATSAVAIIMVNKVVFYSYGFGFPVALTLIHTIVTAIGMSVMAWLAFFEKKALPLTSKLQLASSNTAAIVLNLLSLQLNTVSFYQVGPNGGHLVTQMKVLGNGITDHPSHVGAVSQRALDHITA